MKRSGAALGVAMGLVLLSAACAPASEVDLDVGELGLEALTDKPGGQDTNGTPKLAWHTWKNMTAVALQLPLLENGVINPSIVSVLNLDDPLSSSQEVFDHTVRCALADGVVVSHSTGSHEGRGMVTGASVWTTQGLSQSVITNVLECVIAFVNDKTDGVSVLLTGKKVNNDGEDHSAFIYSEAVWCAKLPSPTVVEVDVYPTLSFVLGCGINAGDALMKRSCFLPGNCGLNSKGTLEFNAECVEVGTPGNWSYVCNGKPCTMTWLLEDDPEWCAPPPPPID